MNQREWESVRETLIIYDQEINRPNSATKCDCYKMYIIVNKTFSNWNRLDQLTTIWLYRKRTEQMLNEKSVVVVELKRRWATECVRMCVAEMAKHTRASGYKTTFSMRVWVCSVVLCCCVGCVWERLRCSMPVIYMYIVCTYMWVRQCRVRCITNRTRTNKRGRERESRA